MIMLQVQNFLLENLKMMQISIISMDRFVMCDYGIMHEVNQKLQDFVHGLSMVMRQV